MFKALCIACPMVLAVVSGAVAETASPPAAPTEGKRQACREGVKSKGLRGMERLDAFQICMAEGRLDCVKQAVAQKVAKDERKKFLKDCMTGASAKNEDKDKENDREQDRDDDKED